MKENSDSQKDVIKSYIKILDDLGELLNKEAITSEERIQITEQMISIADRISAKDTENKDFLKGLIKIGIPVIGGAILLGTAILGVNVKGVKIPTLK